MLIEMQTKVKSKSVKTQYKYVRSVVMLMEREQVFQCSIQKYKHVSYHKDIKEAARMVDLILIKNGEEPVNILKRL